MYGMIKSETARLALYISTIGVVAIAGTNTAFAQTPTCGEQAY